MLGTSRAVAAFAISLIVGACGTGDTKVDPGDLELRDLLGVAPEVATSWDAEQKSSARHVISDALDDKASATLDIGTYKTDDELVRALATLDAKRLDAGDDALGLVHVRGSSLTHQRAQIAADAEIVNALATASGYSGTSPLTVTKEARLTVAAAYIEGSPPRLLVNPVVLTAFDEGDVALENTARQGASGSPSDHFGHEQLKTTSAAGNPYSFYGSVAECAQAQRLRCEACLPSNSCTDAVTTANANDECTMFAANGGRGYYLECINLALAITSVERCTADAVSSCARVTTAASDINQLNANANFLDDMSCGNGLDGCLTKIYGPPSGTFPTLDGGTTSDPPRNPDVNCSESCSSDNNNCEASPNCSCDGPSCNNSLSCDSTCASSNDQSGCGGGCDSCNSADDGGGSSGGGGCGGSSSGGSSGGGCGGDSSSGGGGCSCSDSGGSSGGSSGGGGCGGCSDSSSSGGSSGGGCGGGCSSSDSSSSGGSRCGGGGGGGGSCQVTQREPSAVFAVAFSLGWAFLPIPIAAVIRRRSRKQKRAKEVQS